MEFVEREMRVCEVINYWVRLAQKNEGETTLRVADCCWTPVEVFVRGLSGQCGESLRWSS